MNAVEFSNQFDILYNNVMSDSAPGLSEYEKSVFLTTAQLVFVKQMYKASFEHDEEHRRALDVLVTDYETFEEVETEEWKPRYLKGDTMEHSIFRLPEDLLWIVHETARVDDDDCADGKYVDVVPENYDEIRRDVKNPFRGPSRWRVLRVDDGLAQGGERGESADVFVELVSKYHVDAYAIRYVRKPKPILLEDLYDGLSVDGETKQSKYGWDGRQCCELNEGVHGDILTLAVQLAAASYKRQQ